jgi:hypothetical protein
LHWTFGGFLTFLLYIFASIGSWRLAETIRGTSGYHGLRECSLWRVVAVLSILLAINVGLDGLGRLTTLFRSFAMSGGWYSERSSTQLYLVFAALVAFVFTVIVGLYLARNTSGAAVLSVVVSLLLITFVLVRAVSLHAVDQLIFARTAGVTLSSMIEGGGIFIIIILTLWRREQLPY